MTLEIPTQFFKNDTVYHQFGMDYNSDIFGCGFLNKTGNDCKENNNIYKHYGIVLVLSGKALQIDDKNQRSEIYPGCLIQRIPGKRQTLYIEADGSWLEFFICISKSMFDALVSMDLLNQDQTILYPGLSRAIFNQCTDFLSLMKHTQASELNLLLPEALKIILMFHSLHKKNSTSSVDSEIIYKACIILSEPSSYTYSIHSLADELGMGYEKFRKIFKKLTGVSPGNFVMQKRMDYAKKCLIENNKSIKEIAFDLGFSDSYAFSRQFKNTVGLSPGDFRKNY